MTPYAQWLAIHLENRREFTRFLQGGRADLLVDEVF